MKKMMKEKGEPSHYTASSAVKLSAGEQLVEGLQKTLKYGTSG